MPAWLSVAAIALASSGAAAQRRGPAAPPAGASKACLNDNLHRTKCMIELLLDDVERHEGAVDQGGIADIRQLSSTSYAVSLPKEERVDTVTYRFVVTPGRVRMVGRRSSTKSYR